MKKLRFQTAQWEIELIDEARYSSSSVDYSREYASDNFLTTGPKEHAVSRLGIVVDTNSSQYSCVLTAPGGPTTIHQHSAEIIDDLLFVAAGNQICCLSIPSLELLWHRKVDWGTCFGVHYSQENGCIISHGELNIMRLSLDGEVAWSVSGKDIFTNGFSLGAEYIEVIDFSSERYRIRILDGNITLLPGAS
jgi:hypothetical protein